MNHMTKRLLAFVLMLAMIVTMLPTIGIAAEETQPKTVVELITAEDNAIVQADILDDIDQFFSTAAKRSGEYTLADYVEATDDIIAMVMASETYVEGSIVERGDGFFWQTDTGITCGYFPKDRYEADQRIATKSVDTSALAKWNYSAADSNDVCLIAPMYSEDSSFTDQYTKEALSIAEALGGTAYGLIDKNATIVTIAQAIEKCGVVIFDSHGNTDWGYFYGGSDGTGEADCTSKANTSYISLSTGTGMTTADCAYVSGPYGTYPHAYKDSNGNYVADGTAFANHMNGNAPSSLLWMAICLGMATDGMYAPLRNKGVSVVYGYSQSVSFYGDYLYEASFWDSMISGKTVAEACSSMKSRYGSWDPAYSNYSQSAAVKNYVAFPIVVSNEDAYPGQGNVDKVQTVKSTYTLFSFDPVTVTLSTPSGTTTREGTTNTAMSLPSVAAPDGYTFAGWTTAPITTETTTRPTIYSGSFVPTESVTLYALFSRTDEGESSGAVGQYSLYSGGIAEGDYVIVYESGAMLANDADSSGRIDYTEVTITNDVISEPAATIVWHVAPTSDGYYTIYNEANGVYAAGNGTKNKAALLTSVTNYAKWTVSGSSTYEFVNLGNQSGGVNANLRKNDSYGFACYSTSTGGALSLYASVSGTIYYTTSPTECVHSNAVSVDAVDASCTEIGYTAGVYCNDCTTYISGHETIAATGHSYNAVVTAPTATTQGYTTYTCTACSHSYVDDYTDALGETYTVSFVVPNGVNAISDMSCGKDGITLPTAGVPTGDNTYQFTGWVRSSVDNSTEAPTIYSGTYVASEDTTFYALYTYAIGGTGGSSDYVLTDLANIRSTDIVVITVAYNGTVYALSSLNGSISAPGAITVTVADNKLSKEPAQDLLWNIGGSADSYIIYPDGNANIWLYCNNTNNGVRLGTNSNNTFKINSDYLYNNETSRYLGVYLTNPDWRCYTNTTGNIANQTLAFYVKGDSGITYYTTVISAACAHTNTSEATVEATCTENGSITVTCTDCNAVISTQTIESLGHSYAQTSTTNATCTEAGSIIYTCASCNDSYSQTLPAIGHSFVDGICSACSESEPTEASYAGRYYIAGIRSADTYYQYIMGVMDGTRYDIESSELTQLPTSITSPETNKIFVIEKNTDGTYRIYAEGIAEDAKYLGWTSGNTGCFVTSDSALRLTIDRLDSGLYNIHFTASDAERYLSLNGTATNTYAAWYKSGQTKDLTLIPVQGEAIEHIHNVAYFEGQTATCTEDGVIAYYYCSLESCPDHGTCYSDEALTVVLLEEDLIDPATGHNMIETNVVAPTCTEEGYTEYACSNCNATDIGQIVDSLGHNMTYTDNNNGTHTYDCANDCTLEAVIEDHVYVDGICPCYNEQSTTPEYVLNENLSVNISISVGAEMQVAYTIMNAKVKDFESFYLEVVKDVVGGESVTTIYSIDSGNLQIKSSSSGALLGYNAIYTGIFAMEMGDNFTATLYAVEADGTVNYGVSLTNSIKDYLMEKIEDETTIDELKTLSVDMLNYGAAAQLYFDYDVENLANADLTDEQQSLGTQGIPTAQDNISIDGTGGNITTSVTLQSKVILYVNCAYTKTENSNLEFVVKDAETGEELDRFAPSRIVGKICQGSYDNVGARQMRDLITIELYDNGELISQTLTWSVESYVAQTRASDASSQELINAVNAMLNYGDSAALYLEATNQ